MRKFPAVLGLLFLAGCSLFQNAALTGKTAPKMSTFFEPVPLSDSGRTDAFMESLLRKYPQYFDSIRAHRKDWNVQIIYTQVDRGPSGVPALKNYYFNLDPARYFYPASTVKFPVSLLALQRVNELNELKDSNINKFSTMITEAGYSGQTAVYNDPTTPNGKPNIAHYIKKILMVSDNDAYNRLYEFLGQEYINNELRDKGYTSAQLLHRLNIFLSEDENRHTNPVKFYGENNRLIYDQPLQNNTAKYGTRNDKLGSGYYSGGQLLNGPMNFSGKNRVSLEDLHTMLLSLVFPAKVKAAQRFNLSYDDRRFLLKHMSQFPGESLFPPYDTSYQDAYCKFILYGGEKGNKPKNIRIFNKPGDAYGHMIDVTYVVDFDKKIEFFLSAVIYCNSDGILNDDNYDYDTIGKPFMKHLGEVIYDLELKRRRNYLPDLSEFKFNYDR